MSNFTDDCFINTTVVFLYAIYNLIGVRCYYQRALFGCLRSSFFFKLGTLVFWPDSTFLVYTIKIIVQVLI